LSARAKARKRALDFLYEADIRGGSAIELLKNRGAEDISQISQAEYAEFLLSGVAEHRAKIDELITTYAQGWDMDRMPAVDRNILRIAIFEILWEADLDDQIAASQAVEFAKELSTDDSAGYINGVLGRIIALKPSFTL
jgi:N utilization substance protein B